MKHSIFLSIIFLFFSAAPIYAQSDYKAGIFGGYSFLDFDGGLPDRFEGSDDSRSGGYTGLVAGRRLGFENYSIFIELSPTYILSSVEGSSQIHSFLLPAYLTVSTGNNPQFSLGAGTGPMVTDLYDTNDFGWGVFGKTSALFTLKKNSTGRIGPEVQVFTDLSTSGQNIKGLLIGLRYETSIFR